MKRRLAAVTGAGVLAVAAGALAINSPAGAAEAAIHHYITNLNCSSSFTANMNIRSSYQASTGLNLIYNVTYSSSIVADRVEVMDGSGLVFAMGGGTSTKNDVPKKVNNDYAAIPFRPWDVRLRVYNDEATCVDTTGSTKLLD